MNLHDVIKGPIITEKLDKAREQHRQYSFLVNRQSTKHEVRHAVEAAFKVSVTGIRTMIIRGKTKRVGKSMGKRPNYKKAIVTLKEGDTIELFEGGAA
ncbi:MAG: 50S ribosomal protein L23 [Myxococcaceae bacterium]